MFNLGLGELTVMALLAVIFFGRGRLPDLAQTLSQRLRKRRRRNDFVQPVHEVRPLSGLDWLLLATGFALAFATIALLARISQH